MEGPHKYNVEWKRPSKKNTHIVRFHLYEVQKQTQLIYAVKSWIWLLLE